MSLIFSLDKYFRNFPLYTFSAFIIFSWNSFFREINIFPLKVLITRTEDWGVLKFYIQTEQSFAEN